MKTIVAATDFSAGADRASERAARLAQSLGAELTLLHVFNPGLWASVESLWSGPSPKTDPAAASRRLEQQARQLAASHGIPTRAVVREGRATAGIVQHIGEQPPDLLVLGENGEHWLRDEVLGGTALKVLEAARLPVLLVRANPRHDYREAFLACDLSPCSARLLALSRQLFKHADRHLIHAYQPPFESRLSLAGASDDELHHYRMATRHEAAGRVAAFLAGLPAEDCATLTRHVLHGHPSAVIQERLRRQGGDVLVLGRHGGSVLGEHLLGSVTRNLLHRVSCDVLLVP